MCACSVVVRPCSARWRPAAPRPWSCGCWTAGCLQWRRPRWPRRSSLSAPRSWRRQAARGCHGGGRRRGVEKQHRPRSAARRPARTDPGRVIRINTDPRPLALGIALVIPIVAGIGGRPTRSGWPGFPGLATRSSAPGEPRILHADRPGTDDHAPLRRPEAPLTPAEAGADTRPHAITSVVEDDDIADSGGLVNAVEAPAMERAVRAHPALWTMAPRTNPGSLSGTAARAVRDRMAQRGGRTGAVCRTPPTAGRPRPRPSRGSPRQWEAIHCCPRTMDDKGSPDEASTHPDRDRPSHLGRPERRRPVRRCRQRRVPGEGQRGRRGTGLARDQPDQQRPGAALRLDPADRRTAVHRGHHSAEGHDQRGPTSSSPPTSRTRRRSR